VGLTVFRLEEMLAGEIGDFIASIRAHFQAEALKSESAG